MLISSPLLTPGLSRELIYSVLYPMASGYTVRADSYVNDSTVLPKCWEEEVCNLPLSLLGQLTTATFTCGAQNQLSCIATLVHIKAPFSPTYCIKTFRWDENPVGSLNITCLVYLEIWSLARWALTSVRGEWVLIALRVSREPVLNYKLFIFRGWLGISWRACCLERCIS